MKIGDVKVGDLLALDCSERYSKNLPRPVEVVEIVTVEESYWPRHDRWLTGGKQTRKVRRVKVKFTDEPTGESNRWARYDFSAEKKDAEKVVEARFLLGPWASLRGDVQKTLNERKAAADLKSATEARLEYLFGKKIDKLSSYVSVNTWGGKSRAEVRFEGTELDTVLTLAERGKKAVE